MKMKSSFKPSFPKTPKAPPAPPKQDNTVAHGKNSTGSTPVSKPTTPTKTSGPDKTPQGDSFKKPSTNAEGSSSSSSRPNINAHDLQGPQVQAPKLSESEVQDLAMGRTPGKGKAAPVRPEIQKVTEEMKAEVPGAEVLRFTDQGGHPMLKKPGLPAGTDAGVCSAMTSEWIRTGIEAGGDPKKGSQAFGKLTDNHFGSLIDKQHAEHVQGSALQKKNNASLDSIAKFQDDVEVLKNKQQQRKFINEQLTNPHLTPEQREGLTTQRKELTQDISQGVAKMKKDSASIDATQTELQGLRQDFRTGRGGGHPNVRVQDFEPIEQNFAQKLFDGTQQNGHYRMGLRKDGEGEGEGHVIGLHKTDGKSRLMDANTAEWQTDSHKDLVNLTAEHIERLYPNYTAFDLTRYG